MHVVRIAIAVALLASPAHAWDSAEEIAGAWRIAPPGAMAGTACEIELLAAIAYEFEGVWYVARPFHYEDNRAGCRQFGIDDMVAWSGMPGQSIWLLAEGDAGFMEFTPGEGGWRLAKSGHESRPDLVLTRGGR